MTDALKGIYQFIGELLEQFIPGFFIVVAVILLAAAVGLLARLARRFISNRIKNSKLHK